MIFVHDFKSLTIIIELKKKIKNENTENIRFF